MDVAWRTRSTWEGCDLGVRLLQVHWKSVYRCHLAVAVPVMLLCASTLQVAGWLPALLIWLAKPWLDRSILFVLSRSLFNTPTVPADLWRAQRTVWWSRLWHTLTLRRLSASRAFTQPVLQLEGLRGAALRARLHQVADRHRGAARMMTQCFASAEFALLGGLFALLWWLMPTNSVSALLDMGQLLGPTEAALSTLFYALAVLFTEPFYVAAGFGMYLNRRVELEAWDIEQEFRRAFAA